MGAVRRRVPREPGARGTTDLKRKGPPKKGGGGKGREKRGRREGGDTFFKKWKNEREGTGGGV